MQQSNNGGWKVLLLSRIAQEDGLSGQHLEEATQAAPQRNFAWRSFGVLSTRPAQQWPFDPVKGDAQVEEKA